MSEDSEDSEDGYDYDLVVIGSGPAGEKAGAQAAYFGKRVALVEKSFPVGGTCVHWGTLPSKCLRESAQHLSGLKMRGVAGVAGIVGNEPGSQRGVRVSELLAHKESVSQAESERISRNLERHGIDLVHGRAEMAGPNEVRVHLNEGGTKALRTRFTLIATGTHPYRPSGFDFPHESIYDSDEIIELAEVPTSMIVVGAGVIGSEYAAMFQALGVAVTLVEPRSALLPFLDGEIRKELLASFRSAGMDVRFNTKVTHADVQADDTVIAHLEGGGTIHADRLLYAAGRGGNVKGLGLECVGVETNKRGHIVVDDSYRTACPSIYAVGDVIGFPALASTGMEQGRVAACHAFGLTYKRQLAQNLPYGIYTIPEVSMVGETEESLTKAGRDYEWGIAHFRDNARGKIVGHVDGFVKLIFDAADKTLLGVHILGENAAELVHIGLTVIQLGGTIGTFIDACYNYPTLSECYKYAAYDGLGRLARRSATS
ncbi:MAG: Si-specific NAD(P)(+) transhydrogenase [Planctomycetota bacterium]|jgi:NAD(P) transhydrogenase